MPKRLTTQPSQRLPKRLTQPHAQQLTQILTNSVADTYQPAGNPVNLQTLDLIQSGNLQRNVKSTLES